MEAEQSGSPQPVSPDVAHKPEAAVPGSPIPEEALEPSARVAEALEAGKPVDPEAVKKILDVISQTLKEQGTPLTKQEEKGWRKMTRRLFRAPSSGELPRKETKKKGREDIDFNDYLSTFQYVSDLYGLGDIKAKLGALEGARIATAFVEGWGPYHIAHRFITERPMDQASQQTLEKIQVEGKLRRGSLPKLTSEESGVLARYTLKQLAPFLLSFTTIPLFQIDHRINEQFGREFMNVRRKVNERVANSLFMRDFEFIHDRPAAEIFQRIELGKNGVVTLLSKTYTDIIPRLGLLGGATIPEFLMNWPVALLSLLRLPFLLKGSQEAVREALAQQKEEGNRHAAINAKIYSMVESAELVKTDDAQHAAEALRDAMSSRDELLYGAERAETAAGKKRNTISQIFNVTVPIVGTGWAMWKEQRKHKTKPSYVQAPLGGPFDEVPRSKPTQTPDGFGVDPMTQKTLTDKGQYTLGGGFDEVLLPQKELSQGAPGRKWSYANAINTVPLLLQRYSEASRSQGALEHHTEALIAVYQGHIKAAIQNIRQMEKLLGPYDALDKPDGPKERARVAVSSLPNLAISVKDLSYKDILAGVSLDIPEGSFVTIKGPKGEGKTTLLRHLLGLYEAPAGVVQYGGMDLESVKKYGDESIYTKLAYANQSPQFFEGMSLRENLLLWSRREVPDEKITQVLGDLGMEKFLGDLDTKKRFHFSGGELRMIGLARALLKDPQILFLDEPTTHLDQESARSVMNIIQNLRKKRPEMTVVAITHDPVFETIAEQVVDFRQINKKPPNGNGKSENKAENGSLGDHQVYEAVARGR
ncbi:hypothetical protein A2973_05750 [Candidatus Gottesmanbacteria bacterium RIFCSPLOWO2_01_FULL_49_10]|uniref:ABC transporter domain-containing protein n=1 Tax=Candidatus Gottesmanbacteria bacterium RIFCSPLOWO2_01_FULL_49_10 TaxID=1798396 RepID=A0A1F6B179_9BACT|nr:MAG: hypothetical protein A2973_05750 [Candidatus Gottesmanbacteria bacterium RIFCSPLOWO2_01_FULL_49_10]